MSGHWTEQRTGQQEKLWLLLEPVVSSFACELIDLRIVPGARQAFRLAIVIDRLVGRGAVTLDDCAKVSRAISAHLDVEDPIEGAYDLEVSSPGMNRVLRNREDLVRFLGLTAKISVLGPVGERQSVIGIIEQVTSDSVTLVTGATKTGGHRTRSKATERQGNPRIASALTKTTLALASIEKASLQPTIEQWQELGARLSQESACQADSESDGWQASSERVQGNALSDELVA